MKRIFSVLAVTALMVAMLVASVSPVLAKNPRVFSDCVDPVDGFTLTVIAKQKKIDEKIEQQEAIGRVCSEPLPFSKH
jgi:hypothetical protein